MMRINSMRIINKYCPICDRKNSSDMDLEEFHLSMNLVCKNEYKYSFFLSTLRNDYFIQFFSS